MHSSPETTLNLESTTLIISIYSQHKDCPVWCVCAWVHSQQFVWIISTPYGSNKNTHTSFQYFCFFKSVLKQFMLSTASVRHQFIRFNRETFSKTQEAHMMKILLNHLVHVNWFNIGQMLVQYCMFNVGKILDYCWSIVGPKAIQYRFNIGQMLVQYWFIDGLIRVHYWSNIVQF